MQYLAGAADVIAMRRESADRLTACAGLRRSRRARGLAGRQAEPINGPWLARGERWKWKCNTSRRGLVSHLSCLSSRSNVLFVAVEVAAGDVSPCNGGPKRETNELLLARAPSLLRLPL